LYHILDEMDFLAKHCAVVGIETLMADEVLCRACVKSLEIIGEASRNISDDLKTMHLEIPWRQMIGMRNKLVHHYFGVDWEIVDDALKNELPDIRLNILKIVL
jgi:uncharacterized protein with HEPN domain